MYLCMLETIGHDLLETRQTGVIFSQTHRVLMLSAFYDTVRTYNKMNPDPRLMVPNATNQPAVALSATVE
jgi:hypothetical protein